MAKDCSLSLKIPGSFPKCANPLPTGVNHTAAPRYLKLRVYTLLSNLTLSTHPVVSDSPLCPRTVYSNYCNQNRRNQRCNQIGVTSLRRGLTYHHDSIRRQRWDNHEQTALEMKSECDE